MADIFQVKALYDFDAQPGTGELSIAIDEILTVTRQDVGEGWWEGLNSKGEKGLFPAGYVEVMSSPPPPAMPPPPPPPPENNNQFSAFDQQPADAADDWDDDWDDDDSVYSQDHQGNQVQNQTSANSALALRETKSSNGSTKIPETKGTIKKSFNRFSMFVKSGGEAFILGQTKMTVSSDQCITIVDDDNEIMWSANTSPYTCIIASPKKSSKLKGFKSFIVYQLTPSFNNIVVSRRYKHFDWLHERLEEKFSLIPIPPLPDKQISGRYQEDFIEHRMNQLQMWVNRICRHPVLSQCDVWIHFLTCTDEKRWKTGKRNAEKDRLIGGSFFHAICTPPAGLDNTMVEKQTEQFSKFVSKTEESVNRLFNVAVDQQKKYSGPFKKELIKMSDAFKDLSAAFQMVDAAYSDALTTAIKHTADTYDEIGKIYEEQPKYDAEPMADVLHEYKGMLAAWPDVLTIQKSALVKTSEHKRMAEEGKLNPEDVVSISHRTDVISYAILAEVNHFQHERVAYFKSMMQTYLAARINFHQRIVEKLQDTLSMYDNA